MPKGFLVKRLEDMNVEETVSYRPWCEDSPQVQQETPVDFSLKGKKSHSGDERQKDSFPRSEVGNRIFVRTPDSGFSSPSDSELVRKLSCDSEGNNSFMNLSLHGEQVAPLALVKKRISSENKHSAKHPEGFSSNFNQNEALARLNDTRLLLANQANPLHLLSSSLYWSHGAGSVHPSVSSFASFVSSACNLNLSGQCLISPEGSSSQSSVSPLPPCSQTTPMKSPPRSPLDHNATPIKRKTPSTNITPEKKSKSVKRTKASRRLNFDEDKTSPVSGTIIRELEEGEEPLVVRKGDIDPAYNVVEITEEAKAELSKIENKIGDYVCRLCKELYDDAFGLAQHRCSRIIHVEYRCPECDKVFNCPANLASHRRWHKPKGNSTSNHKGYGGPSNDGGSTDFQCESKVPVSGKKFSNNNIASNNNIGEPPELIRICEGTSEELEEQQYECTLCFKKFKRQSYLRKHLESHQNERQNRLTPPREEYKQKGIYSSFDNDFPFSSSSCLTSIKPLLSPPFTEEILRCRLCSATFFTPAALHLHSSTVHGTDIDPSLIASSLHIPNSPFSPKRGIESGLLEHTSPYSTFSSFLHRPSQITAPS